VLLVRQVLREIKALLVLPDRQGRRAIRGPLESRVPQDPLDPRVTKDRQASLVPQDPKARPDRQDLRAIRVVPE